MVLGPAGAVSGQLAARFYTAQGALLETAPVWSANDYAQPDEAVRQAGAVHHAAATQLRLATTVTLDEGWLDFSALRLQTAGEPLPVVGGQTYSITVQLSGELPLAETGRLLLLTDGIPTLIWQNEAGYQEQNTVISHTFTAAPGANAVQLLVEAPLAGGWLAVEETVLVRVITRSTYMLAGQAVAVRVAGDPDGNDGVYYLYSDHLGSATAMTDPNGSLVGEVVRYYPFGGYRTAPTARQSAISDRGFTGHKSGENGGSNDLGLIYMNARYFAPYLNRFISADTLVPDPANPQSYNRYSYVLNSPLNFRDPSGHNPVCNHDGSICSDGAYDDRQPPTYDSRDGLPPVPVVEIIYREDGSFDAERTWAGLGDVELLARLMLSEESYKILDPFHYEDAVGAAWVAINRTRPNSGYDYAEGDLFSAIIAPNQFHGMILIGNAKRAANPEAYPDWFEAGNPNAGRDAYWKAIELAEGIIYGIIPDPTEGRLIYGDALANGTRRERTAFWSVQGSAINDPYDPHVTIPEIRQLSQIYKHGMR